MTCLDWAKRYVELGFSPIPLSEGKKHCTIKGWPSKDFSADLESSFRSASGVALHLKDGLTQVDFDCKEAELLGQELLPTTGAISGRQSSPRMHLVFRVKGQPIRRSFKLSMGTGRDMVVEIRSVTGASEGVAMPVQPSFHPEGEQYAWHTLEKPAEVKGQDLINACVEVTIGTAIARVAKGGSRHEVFLRTASVMLRRGWNSERVKRIFQAVCRIADDHEMKDRLKAVDTTEMKIEEGKAVTTDEDLLELFPSPICFSEFIRLIEGGSNSPSKNQKKKNESLKRSIVDECLKLSRVKDRTGTVYVKIPIRQGHNVVSIESRDFNDWISSIAFTRFKAPSKQLIHDSIHYLLSLTRTDPETPTVQPRVRCTREEDVVWVQLGPSRFARIDSEGWTLVPDSPVWFLWSPAMEELPDPEPGLTLATLREQFGIARNYSWLAICSWLVSATAGRGPFPVLLVNGPQGSGKSTLCTALKRLVDPESSASIGSGNLTQERLFQLAKRRHVLMIDNQSAVSTEMSDGLCRLASGGEVINRRLYTDDEELHYQASKPLILNGITEFATAPDLLDRSVLCILDPVSPQKRKLLSTMSNQLEKSKPQILGAIYTAICNGLRRVRAGFHPELPRNADSMLLALACEENFECPGTTVLEMIEETSSVQSEVALENSAVGRAALILGRKGWKGTATSFYEEMKSRDMAKLGSGVSVRKIKRELDCLRGDLFKRGISYYTDRTNGERLILLEPLESTDPEPKRSFRILKQSSGK